MNIFVLDSLPAQAALYHVDKHVVKMILESAQMLSTAHHILEGPLENLPCKPTHTKHPCTIWTRTSKSNYLWLFSLLENLCQEYTFRYQKKHKYDNNDTISILGRPPTQIPDIGLTPFAQAMPDLHKRDNAIDAYRQYYIQEKSHIAKWKNRDVPLWFQKINNI